MNAQKDWLAEIDGAEQLQSLRSVLADLHVEIDTLEHSSYAEEAPVRDQLRTLELLAEYGEQKLTRMLA
jgi:hypothetical protein